MKTITKILLALATIFVAIKMFAGGCGSKQADPVVPAVVINNYQQQTVVAPKVGPKVNLTRAVTLRAEKARATQQDEKIKLAAVAAGNTVIVTKGVVTVRKAAGKAKAKRKAAGKKKKQRVAQYPGS